MKQLREANLARQVEWKGSDQISYYFKANELAGEAGEACNVIKKLERERLGIAGSRATPQQLAEELADVVICVDLLAIDFGIDLDPIATIGRSAEPLSCLGNRLAARVGWVCYSIDTGEDNYLEDELHAILQTVSRIAENEGIDLELAVAMKFNKTSEKVGLTTRMAA